MKATLANLLHTGWPEAEWSLDPETYEGLTWFGPGDKPTERDIETHRAASEAVLWGREIAAERERRLETSMTVTLSDGDYVIPVTDRARAEAPTAARRARKDGKTRPFPTDKGIIERSADDLDLIEDALDRYTTAVWRRAGELERMIADGTIMENDLEKGWPA